MPARRSDEEAARLGDEIYERNIRRQVEATHRGEVVVALPLRGPAGQGREIDAVIDTAYNGFLP